MFNMNKYESLLIDMLTLSNINFQSIMVDNPLDNKERTDIKVRLCRVIFFFCNDFRVLSVISHFDILFLSMITLQGNPNLAASCLEGREDNQDINEIREKI